MSGLAGWLRAGPLHELRRAVSWHRRLAAAGLAAAAVAVGLAALEPDSPATEPVLTAARDLPAGTRLSPADLRTARYPPDVAPSGAYGEVSDLIGHVLAAPARLGEPVTDRRVLGPSLLEAYGRPGEDVVAAPVRVADPGVLAYLRVGSRVDVLATENTSGIAAAAPVPAGFGPRSSRSAAAGASTKAPVPAAGERGREGGRLGPAGAGLGVTRTTIQARTVASTATVIALPGAEPDTGGALGDVAGAMPGAAAGGQALILLAVPADVARDLARAAVTSRLSLVLRG